MPVKSAAIIGGGIAGLTAALALSGKGVACDVFEQAEQFAEVGAGLQLSPNASRVLARLGILADIEKVWLEPESIRLVSGTSLKALAAVPAEGFARDRWGAPYGVLHRATLQGILLKAVLSNPLCRLHQGLRIEPTNAASLATISGSAPPDIVIGADGVWSRMRRSIAGSGNARFSGHVAWRFVVPRQEAPSFLDRRNVVAFLGPASHLVCYPLDDAGDFNIVAITTGKTPGETWSAHDGGSGKKLSDSHFAGWAPGIRSLLASATGVTHWPLYEVGAGHWHDSRNMVLIGDAAHAMLPFAAQGAAMAIEDAYELAETISAQPLPDALTAFEMRRKPRIEALRKRGDFNRFAYHARGPIRLGRDLVLSLRPPQSLASDLDWIYGYKSD
ncbi:FAD-dependent monooxygenase [Rhizobiaceae bacterium n13]|uniref:FAD-dependent monooxygenase n=1 Tax=Ferirhizobium litorale TaxID=2927786 RepID=A0AAE3U5I6_9HYPH|nr:FAD-dependent monooxygenase [Fererhizobium litorale]MDI7863994.1 FAD-dependent monooxygenase [Fererhizobium litorale]MDI7924523.1 FAD-dependent monooxygenase [Fererhizobium litorale]